jgi:hypothetical protein
MSFTPPLPPGYTYSLAKKRNLLLAYHALAPVLYYDEQAKAWRELDRHVSEVHPAQSSAPADR